MTEDEFDESDEPRDGLETGAPEPRSNPYLVGHEAAAQSFLTAWQSGRMAHAWLLSGPRGIGKATFAYRLARYILAKGAMGSQGETDLFGAPAEPSLQMAESDPVFARVRASGHADFRVVEREKMKTSDRLSNVIGVDQVRKIIDFMYLTPAESAWRVVLIDGADAMNTAAANAVLKVLEEPPRQTILLLIAHNADRLLPTIRSRCRRLELRPLTDSQTRALIGRYRPDLKSAEVHALTMLADGSIGRALELADEGGVAAFANIVELMADAPHIPSAKLHNVADLAMKGDNFRTMTGLLTWWLARVATLAAQGSLASVPEIIPGERATAARLTGSPAAVSEVWRSISYLADRTLAVNIDKKRSFIGAAMQVARLAA
ncbi:MAG: DNA polymerase III subunit delta' [Rhodobacteraceae bacterium]|nr:DNA polymerase III subunit delta' [Paracoccaceae bacterium]